MIPYSYPDRPQLAFRVGITGTRSLNADQAEFLAPKLRHVLSITRQQVERIAAQDLRVLGAYAHPPGDTPKPVFRFISPLARGADRLAATQALALGYRLHVPMPFPLAKYEEDFDTEEDLAEFRTLFAAAGDDWLAIDGDHGHEADHSYEAVGRYVFKHCDLLIAVWDDHAAGGRGGTGDIVRFAVHAGVPVWWLHATDGAREARWIADPQDLRYPRPNPADAALNAYLEASLPPPAPRLQHRKGVLGWLAGIGASRHISPETVHFEESARPPRWCWRAYAVLMRMASGKTVAWSATVPPPDPVAQYWFARYQPADARAGEYAARYRSGYVWVFLLGTVSLCLGALGIALGRLGPRTPHGAEMLHWLTFILASFELGALIAILGLVLAGTRRDWQARSIEYRLFAELCRKQLVLGALGGALPITHVRGLSAPDSETGDRGAWVGWLFAAEQRASPLPRGNLSGAPSPRTATLDQLIAEQTAYHTSRADIAGAAGDRLAGLGGLSFTIVLICLMVKLLLVSWSKGAGWEEPLGLLAAILPGISAAFIGIRAFAELDLLAEQSRHLLKELRRTETRLARLDISRSLASQDLAAEAASVATLMLQDLDGWATLFRVKAMETT